MDLRALLAELRASEEQVIVARERRGSRVKVQPFAGLLCGLCGGRERGREEDPRCSGRFEVRRFWAGISRDLPRNMQSNCECSGRKRVWIHNACARFGPGFGAACRSGTHRVIG